MIRTFDLYIILFTFILNSNAELNVEKSCETSRSEQGTCKNIYQCPIILKIITQQRISQGDRQYLQDSVCRWEDKTPVVCCPNHTILPETTRSTQAPPYTNSLQNHPSLRLLPEKFCGNLILDRIIKGNVTELGEYPWLALLGYKRSENASIQYLCGGVLINSRYILTAAHCTTKIMPYSLFSVRLGEYDQTSNPDCVFMNDDQICAPEIQEFRIERVISHEQYNSLTKHNDIALLRLEQEANITEFVNPICIPYDSYITNKSYYNKYLTITGWGKFNFKTFASSEKMVMNIPVRDFDHCRQQYRQLNRHIISSQMCAGGEKGKDCIANSGGPLMVFDQSSYDGRFRSFVTGILSYGPKDCGTEGWPSVFTKVGSFAKWILDNLSE